MYKVSIISCVLITVLLTGCSAIFHDSGSRKSQSSSLIDFLYPKNKQSQQHRTGTSTLNLPVRIGLAFVPSRNPYRQISQGEQLMLLEKVKKAFDHYPFISEIKMIPNSYMKPKGGFDTLDQLSRLYNLDLMALVSYDQLSTTRENNAALLYLTIVGLYVIPGNNNSVQTFVDTAVFDIKSRKLLLRAPGVSKLESLSTAVGVSENRSMQSIKGFNLAVSDMNKNLDSELQQLRKHIKSGKSTTKIHYRHNSNASSGGGGTINLFLLLLLTGLILCKAYKDHGPKLLFRSHKPK